MPPASTRAPCATASATWRSTFSICGGKVIEPTSTTPASGGPWRTVRTFSTVAYCRCGAPLPPGVHFCSHCGRPAATTPAVVTCGHCGQPLPADANFCSFCGNTAAPQYEAAAEPVDATMARPLPEDEPEPRL